MTFKNGLSEYQNVGRHSGSKSNRRRGNAKALTAEHFNVVEMRPGQSCKLRWLGRLLCYTSAILSFGLAVAFGLSVV